MGVALLDPTPNGATRAGFGWLLTCSLVAGSVSCYSPSQKKKVVLGGCIRSRAFIVFREAAHDTVVFLCTCKTSPRGLIFTFVQLI